ncbi:replication factor C small subunit [Candidatus Woesearchaeota archaeon]|nr:replication factor C small subunit [Candidatus Woesearchaeota archaeon]
MDIWTEKYRPKQLSEIKGQEHIMHRLHAFVTNKNMPHLMFAGPAGVGKTTAAIAISRELFGDSWRDNILELNASDERGIDVVRVKVKDFARTKAIENDALTKEAQDALRRTMEDYAATTRFILSCNYSSKVIPPIQSRCAIFRFKPLAKDVVENILKKVAETEGFEIDSEAIDLVYEASEGDMRKAENMLQACAATAEVVGEKKRITIAFVKQIVSFAEPKEIEAAVKLALAGKFLEAKKKLADIMVAHGLSGMDVIKQIQKEIWNLDVDEKLKIKLTKACGDYEFRLVEGSNEFIQLAGLLAEMGMIGVEK